MTGQVTAVYEQHGDWIIGFVEEIPGVNTQARTMEEARANLREALDGILALNQDLSRRSRPDAIREPMAVPTR